MFGECSLMPYQTQWNWLLLFFSYSICCQFLSANFDLPDSIFWAFLTWLYVFPEDKIVSSNQTVCFSRYCKWDTEKRAKFKLIAGRRRIISRLVFFSITEARRGKALVSGIFAGGTITTVLAPTFYISTVPGSSYCRTGQC